MKKNILIFILISFFYKIHAQNFEGSLLYKITNIDTLLVKGSIFYRTNSPTFLNFTFKDFYSLKEIKRDDNESTYHLFDFKNKFLFVQGLRIGGIKKYPIDDCDVDDFEIIATNEIDYIYQKKCFKYLVKNKSNQEIYQIWALKDQQINLPKNIQFGFFRKIEIACFIEKIGFPMRIIIRQDENEFVNTHIKLELIEIKNEKLEIRFFEKYKNLQKPLFLDFVPTKN